MAARTGSRPDRARIHLSGVFDGSRAMQLADYLRREPAAEIVVDFSDVERFEAFGVDVLLRELAARRGAGATVRCCSIPPCVTERLEEIGIAVSSSLHDPRWAPWAR
ncbi:MAG: STAS domain-containing protein [Candidatus Rokubacteria bacterium]|nr:STAS domain-containing protein [Candidatus Rokubacteria bacterium]